jgi:hypothetical protein
MKKQSANGKVPRRKLILNLERVAQLTPEQLRQVPGGSSAQDASCGNVCSRPD